MSGTDLRPCFTSSQLASVCVCVQTRLLWLWLFTDLNQNCCYNWTDTNCEGASLWRHHLSECTAKVALSWGGKYMELLSGWPPASTKKKKGKLNNSYSCSSPYFLFPCFFHWSHKGKINKSKSHPYISLLFFPLFFFFSMLNQWRDTWI